MDVKAKLKQKRGCVKGQSERERLERDRHKQGEGREMFFLGMGGHEMKSWRPTLDFR